MTEIYIDWLTASTCGREERIKKVITDNAYLDERKRKLKEVFRIFKSWIVKKQINLCSL